jgi:hypothetical protein
VAVLPGQAGFASGRAWSVMGDTGDQHVESQAEVGVRTRARGQHAGGGHDVRIPPQGSPLNDAVLRRIASSRASESGPCSRPGSVATSMATALSRYPPTWAACSAERPACRSKRQRVFGHGQPGLEESTRSETRPATSGCGRSASAALRGRTAIARARASGMAPGAGHRRIGVRRCRRAVRPCP